MNHSGRTGHPMLMPSRIWLGFLVSLLLPAAGPPPWRYEARLSADAKVLEVEGHLPAGVDGTFSVEDGAERFVERVEQERNGAWAAVEKVRDAWYPDADAPLRFRYRFRLGAAKNHLGGMIHGGQGITMASPAAWVLRPWKAQPETPVEVHVTLPEGIRLVTGLRTTLDSATISDTYDHLDYAPYTAFGPFAVDRFETGGVEAQVAFLPDRQAVKAADLRAWCGSAVANLRTAYGSFPAQRLVVMVLPSGGSGVVFGSTMGGGGPAVAVYLARTATAEDLRQDWILTHECIHLSHPNLPREQHWFEEGLATYLEPLARARRGLMTPEEVWRSFVQNLPEGLPGRGEPGLDRNRSWGATYWGGTLYFLLADLEIRERSGNRKSLDDALRAIVAAGGNHEARWDLERTLETGDAAVGSPVLRDLHRRLGTVHWTVDLEGLFRRLGVRVEGDRVAFDEAAPLAALRRSLTARR